MNRRGVKSQSARTSSRSPRQKVTKVSNTSSLEATSHENEVTASQEEDATVNGLQRGAVEDVAIVAPQKQWIDLGLITLDAGTQSRKSINASTIDDYAEQMADERWQWEREPLPILFFDGENYYPGDGHHRLMAADSAGIESIYTEVRPGTRRDAIFYSTSANQFHGLPRTNADKWNQVELLLRDEEWQKMSDRAIAEHCGVSGPFVGKVRANLAESGTANIYSKRVDKRGRKLDTSNIGAKPKDPPASIASFEMTELAEDSTQAASEAMQELNSTRALHENNGAADLKLEADSTQPSIERKLDRLPQEETALEPHLEEQSHTQDSAIQKVAENQIELLSQRMGAKAVALIALDFCTLDEIKEIHADLSSGLERLEEQD